MELLFSSVWEYSIKFLEGFCFKDKQKNIDVEFYTYKFLYLAVLNADQKFWM